MEVSPLRGCHPEAELIQIPDQLAPVLVLQQDLPAFTAPVFDLDIYNLPLAEIGPSAWSDQSHLTLFCSPF